MAAATMVHRALHRVGAALRSPFAPGFLFLILGLVCAVGFWKLEHQQTLLIETQQAINQEQQARIASVCDAVSTSNRNLARAMHALIIGSNASQERIDQFTEDSGLDELEHPPEQCAEVYRPLPRPLP